jgi:hypothetical protein
MIDGPTIGRLLIGAGVALVVVGVLVLIAPRVPLLGSLGRLPGDFVFRRGSTTIAFPIVTSLLLSILLTIALNILLRR